MVVRELQKKKFERLVKSKDNWPIGYERNGGERENGGHQGGKNLCENGVT